MSTECGSNGREKFEEKFGCLIRGWDLPWIVPVGSQPVEFLKVESTVGILESLKVNLIAFKTFFQPLSKHLRPLTSPLITSYHACVLEAL